MAANSDGSGSVADGGVVGCWTAHEASGFTAKWIQATAGSRPTYSTNRDGSPGIYGNGTSWFLQLDSTTALNGGYTLLVSSWNSNETASLFSHNSLNLALRTAANGMDTTYIGGVLANTASAAWRKGLSGTGNRSRGGVTWTGTAHNGNAPRLLCRSTGSEFSTSSFLEIVVCPSLTGAEIDIAHSYLV